MRAQAPQERSGDPPRFRVRPKVPFFVGVSCLGGCQERFGEHFGTFLEPFWKKRAEKESTGPERALRRFSEVPSTTKSTVFFKVLAVLEAVRRGFGSILGAF